jgi:tetratricopeptide (TPR) repeat protein
MFRILARGYSREDLREITVKILGKETPLSFREGVFRFTRGNVRHIRWLLWHIKESGAQTNTFLEMTFPQIVERRFQALSAEDQPAVIALAVLGSECPGPWVDSVVLTAKRVSGGTSLDALPAKPEGSPGSATLLESLVEKGWAVVTRARRSEVGPFYAIADASVAQILQASLDAGRKKSLHHIWGVELLGQAEENVSWFPQALRHFRLARDVEKSREAVFPALEYLEGLGCCKEALKTIQELLEDLPALGDAVQRELKLKSASLLEATRQHEQAIKVYRELGDGGAEKKSHIHRRMGDVHGRLGEREAQVEEYTAGLASLEPGEKSPERLQLLCALATVHLEIDQLEESEHYLQECRKLIEKEGTFEDKERLEVTRVAEKLSFRLRDYAQAIELEQSVLELCRQMGDEESRFRSLHRLAHLHALRSEWQESAARLRDALSVAEQCGSRWLFAQALYALGLFERDRGNLESALKRLLEARGIFEDLGRNEGVHGVTSALFGLELELGHFHGVGKKALTFVKGWLTAGEATRERDRHDFALLDAEKRRELLKQLESGQEARKGSPKEQDRSLTRGRLLEDEGRLKDAQRLYRTCLQSDGPGGSPLRSRAFHSLARIATLTGDDDSALRCLEEGLEFRGASPSRELLVDAYLDVSAIFLGRGDFSRSIDYGSRGFKLAIEAGALDGVVRALLGLSDFLIEAGLHSEAVDVARGAALLASEKKLLRWEIVACRELVKAITFKLDEEIPEALLPRWLELSTKLSCPLETARLKLELGWVRYREDAFEDALRLAREGIEVARSTGLSPLIDELLHLVGVVESAFRNPRKNFLRALEALEQALIGAEARRRSRLRWEVLRALSELYRGKGKSDLAEELEDRARELKRIASGTLPPGLSELSWRPRLEISNSARAVARSKQAFPA